jgi:hypothetical protein
MVSRRFFIQLLAATAATAKNLVLAPDAKPPELPEIPHDPIPIGHELFLSFDSPWFGRVKCGEWVLNEKGIFCNVQPIKLEHAPLIGGTARNLFLQDPRHLWMMTVLPLKQPIRFPQYGSDPLLWGPGELKIMPDLMDHTMGYPLSFEEMRSWKR